MAVNVLMKYKLKWLELPADCLVVILGFLNIKCYLLQFSCSNVIIYSGFFSLKAEYWGASDDSSGCVVRNGNESEMVSWLSASSLGLIIKILIFFPESVCSVTCSWVS